MVAKTRQARTLFQFYKVRLKQSWSHTCVTAATRFQFYKVRLKRPPPLPHQVERQISILQSSIKTLHVHESRPLEKNFNSTKFD